MELEETQDKPPTPKKTPSKRPREEDADRKLQPDDFEPLALIGRGAFGEVRRVQWRKPPVAAQCAHPHMQLRDDLSVALLAGDDQRRGAVVVGLVHVGVCSEQLRDDSGVAKVAGHH